MFFPTRLSSAPFALLLLLPVCGSALGQENGNASEPLTVPVDGAPFRASLLGIDAQWQLALRLGDATRTLPASELVSWGQLPKAFYGPHLLVLADGSRLSAEVTTLSKGSLSAESIPFAATAIPLERLAGAILQVPADPLRREQLIERIESARGPSDRVLLSNGDDVNGAVRSLENRTLRIESNVGPLDIEFGRIEAIVFNPSLLRRPKSQGLRAVAGFRDGSRLVAVEIVADAKQLRVALDGDLRWTASPDELVFLQPLGGKAVYLSDLSARYRHIPYLNLNWPYRADRNVLGGPLESGGRAYLKGLGVHSTSLLSYALSEPYRRFEADIAIDDHTAGRGSVRFRVFVDGQVKYTSPTVRGGQPPLPVRVDLDGAKQLDLVVDFADRADELDHANWLNARLIQ